jgi:hypothetical protein
MNYETIKKIKPVWVISLLLVVCLAVIAWEFGWKEIEQRIYQKGFSAGQLQGRNEIFSWEIQQIQMFGGFTLTFPTLEGTSTVKLRIEQ